MLTVKSDVLELRGISHKVANSGKVYYVVNVESSDGTPHALYCPDANAFESGLVKGDSVLVSFNVNYYKGNERLVVTSVERVSTK